MAYINTAEVAEIRKALKVEFGSRFKFSVTRQHGTSVSVAIVAGVDDMSALWAEKSQGEYGYGTLDVNQFYISEDRYGAFAGVFEKINNIIKTAPANAEGGRAYFDESDSQTDYFHTAYYYDIGVGKWDRPYTQKAA
jgi:hypothetical protein